jgi:hypothetical protein
VTEKLQGDIERERPHRRSRREEERIEMMKENTSKLLVPTSPACGRCVKNQYEVIWSSIFI